MRFSLAKENSCTEILCARYIIGGQRKKIVSPSHRQSTRSKINVRWLNTPERTERYSQLRTRLDTKLKQVKHLKDRISSIVGKSHVILDLTIQSDLGKLMSEMTTQVHKECPDGSFRQTFWDQQL